MTETDIRSQTFTLTRADYTAYYWSAYFGLFTTLPRAILIWLIAVVAWLPFVFNSLMAGHYATAGLIALGVAVAWCAVLPGLGILTYRRALARMHNAYRPRIAIVSGRNVTIEGPGFADHRTWAQFRRVTQTKRLIFLSMTAGAAMIVPRSAFATAAQGDAFIAECRRNIAGSRHRQAKVFDTPLPATPLPGGLETPPYHLEFALYFKLMTYGLYRTYTRPLTLVTMAAAFLAFPVWGDRAAIASGHFDVLWPSIAGFGGFVAFFPPGMAVLNWLRSRKKPEIGNARRVGVTPDQVRMYGDGFDISTSWQGIRRIDRRFGALHFWTAPVASIAVPLSAFASPEDAQAFQDQATAWWHTARAAQAS